MTRDAHGAPETAWARVLRTLPMCAPGLALAAWCGAATLHSGDIVLARSAPDPRTLIVLLDPATLDTTFVSYGPIVTASTGVAVDRLGRILVADWYSGIVQVDATTGAQSVLASTAQLGGIPGGLCVDREGHLFVSVRGAAPGVVRVTPDGSAVTPVTSGDHISYPGGLTIGPDGALYVTEAGLPDDNGGVLYGIRGHGSILRVDAETGSQTLVAADSLFLGPFDIAFVSADKVWSLQGGYVAGRRGCFIETRLSDGRSTMASGTFDCRSRGIAVNEDGAIYASDCHTIGPDCYQPYVTRLPAGPDLIGFGGHMAVVPQDDVPTRRSSWGTLKTIYR